MQIVGVRIKPEQRVAWLELVRTAAAQTRAEPGCDHFDVCEDLESPNTFVLVERWANWDAQYDHFRNPRFGELMTRLADVLASPPDIRIYEVASTHTFEDVLAAAGVGQ